MLACCLFSKIESRTNVNLRNILNLYMEVIYITNLTDFHFYYLPYKIDYIPNKKICRFNQFSKIISFNKQNPETKRIIK